jgi:hypothetical protein
MGEIMDASSDGVRRRQYLSAVAGLAGATTAGCVSWDQTGATDVIVYSLAADRTTVSLVITDTDATDPHTSRTLEVSQGEKIDPVNRGKLPTNTSYTVEATVEGGTTDTFEWADPTLDLAPLYVVIEDPQNIEFLFHAG